MEVVVRNNTGRYIAIGYLKEAYIRLRKEGAELVVEMENGYDYVVGEYDTQGKADAALDFFWEQLRRESSECVTSFINMMEEGGGHAVGI